MDVLSDVMAVMRVGRPHSTRPRYTTPFGRQFSSVDGAGFHVVLQGTCWLFPPDGDPVMLGPGDLVFLPRGSAHGLADSPTTPLVDTATSLIEVQADNATAVHQPTDTVMLCGAYLMDRTRSHPLLNDLPDVIRMPAWTGSHPALRAAVDLLDSELGQARPGTDAMIPALLDVLLLHILRAWFDEQATQSPGGWAAALHDAAVTAALSAIHGEPHRPWTVAELGAKAGLSRAAFARRFTTLVGQSPLAYLTWWRMTLAGRILRDEDTPLSAVARSVGYTSEFAFAHAFKREYGQPPGRFRRSAHRDALDDVLARLEADHGPVNEDAVAEIAERLE